MKTLRLPLLLVLLVSATLLPAGLGARARDPVIIHKTGTGSPLLFVGGVGCPAAVWDPVVRELSGRHTCLVASIAGFAGQAAAGPPDIDAMEAAIARAAAGERLAKPVLIGHSFGGSLALALAAAHPDLFSRVIVVDAYPSPLSLVRPGITPDEAAAQAGALKAATLGQSDAEFRAQCAVVAKMLVASPADAEKVAGWMAASDRAHLAEAQARMLSRDLRPELSKISVPLLVIGTWKGREAMGFTRAKVEQQVGEQYASVPAHTAVISDTARHFVMLDDPAWLVGQIRRFLGE